MNERSLLLVLNAAEARVQIVLVQANAGVAELLCEQDWSAPSRGTEILPAAVEQMLRLLQRKPDEIERIACVIGPGSFTGIRLVLSFAAAMRRAAGMRIAPLNYLQALAASAPVLPSVGERIVRVLTYARRGLVHRQDFYVSDGVLPVPLNEPEMSETERAADGLEILVKRTPVQIIGSGLTRNASAVMPLLPPGCAPLPVLADQPNKQALLALAMAAPDVDGDPEPLYLRSCDAEDNLPHIAKLHGKDPDAVRTELDRLLKQSPSAHA